MEVELAWMGLLNGAVEGQLYVVQGERDQSRSRKAVRAEETGHVSKLCVKTLFNSENFHS